MDAMATALRGDWERIGEAAASRQQAICDALARAADDIGAQSQAHAAATIAEISTLVAAASEAPRAAAELVAELRQKLSDSMVRDTALIAERTQLMETLGTLLEAVNHASTEQRGAIDALVSTTSSLLEQAGARFGDQVEAGAASDAGRRARGVRVAVVAPVESSPGLSTSATATTAAVMRCWKASPRLETAGTRSDEQLAYYVAQARRFVDLSVLAISNHRELRRCRRAHRGRSA